MKDKLIKALRDANLYSHEATRGALFAYDYILGELVHMPLDKVLDWLCESYERRLEEEGNEAETYITPEELRKAMHLPKDAISNPPFEEQ